MESLSKNPSLKELITKVNEIISTFNGSLPETNDDLKEVKELVSFGSDVLAGKLNAKLWYFKTKELMAASTELCEGDSCFVLANGATTGNGTFEYWYVHKTTDVSDIIDSYVNLANPDLVAVKLQDMTLKDIKERLSLLTDQTVEIQNLATRLTNFETDTNSTLKVKADLVNGLVPSTQLPSFVDDVINGWFSDEDDPLNFYAEDDPERTTPIEPESGKIYINLLNNRTYRWGGSFFVEISKSLALGETASTAFAGNKGKALQDKIDLLKSFVFKDLVTNLENAESGKALDSTVGTQLDGKITLLSETVAASNAAAHNAIYRGKDLTNIYTIEEICQRISSGTFEDLYVGDYFDITISTVYTSSEIVRCVIAGFDMYYMNGGTAFNNHHAVIVPKNCFSKTAAMNSTNVTTGGYFGSAMHTTVLSTYATALGNVFGAHLLTHRDLLSTAVDTAKPSMAGAGYTGCSSNWEWKDVKLRLMSEIQVYGSTVFSSSFYDVGAANLQFPLFRHNPRAKVAGLGGTGDGRQWYWLSAVASATAFAGVNSYGSSNNVSASDTDGVRPQFCIG